MVYVWLCDDFNSQRERNTEMVVLYSGLVVGASAWYWATFKPLLIFPTIEATAS